MRKSEKKLLVNNVLMIALAIAGLLLVVVGCGGVEKINAINLTVQRDLWFGRYSLSFQGRFDDSGAIF